MSNSSTGVSPESKQDNQLPSAANFSDALRLLGHPFQTLHSSIQPVFRPINVTGPAFTVRCYPGATWALEKALEEAPVGSVLVEDGGSYSGAVLMGGLMSLRARIRGLKGAVIDGAVRDWGDLVRAQWPIFAVSTIPRAGTHDAQGGWNIPVSCGGVVVHPGDWVVGDSDGVVAVPNAMWKEAVRQAGKIEAKEQFLEERLRAGSSLADAVSEWTAKPS